MSTQPTPPILGHVGRLNVLLEVVAEGARLTRFDELIRLLATRVPWVRVPPVPDGPA
jgi:hypothetical protein